MTFAPIHNQFSILGDKIKT